jgi:HTH-type transcriptional regulator/antitoxin HigA
VSRTINKGVSDSYLDLIKRFPLRPIRSTRQFDQAVAVMNELALRDEGTLDAGEQDYLDTLTLLVEAYDQQHFKVDTSDVTPLELLRHLMQGRGMNVSDLGRVFGSQALASMVLAGKRQISRDKAKRLAAYFGLEPGAFI